MTGPVLWISVLFGLVGVALLGGSLFEWAMWRWQDPDYDVERQVNDNELRAAQRLMRRPPHREDA